MDHALHHVLEPSLEQDVELAVTAGQWPDGLSGHAFIIGPSQPTAVDFLWGGPGIVTRVDLATRHWRSKRVVTPDLAILGGVNEYPEVNAHPLFPGVYTTAHPVEDLDDGCMWWCNVDLRPRGNSTTDVDSPLWQRCLGGWVAGPARVDG